MKIAMLAIVAAFIFTPQARADSTASEGAGMIVGDMVFVMRHCPSIQVNASAFEGVFAKWGYMNFLEGKYSAPADVINSAGFFMSKLENSGMTCDTMYGAFHPVVGNNGLPLVELKR